MPRKRRYAKRREVPQGLAQVSKCEIALWSSHGPLFEPLEGDASGMYIIWPDVDAWATFYGSIRDQLWAGREHLQESSACEAMFGAWLAGDDVEAARDETRRARPDPRAFLGQHMERLQ